MEMIRISLKTILSFSLGAILLAIVLSGYAQQKKDTPRYGGTLRVGIVSDIINLNPFLDQRSVDAYVRSLIFEGLTAVDKDMNMGPGLAQSWEISQDGKTYTFHLRKGVKFHNGNEMDAEDVKWTVEYVMNPNNRASTAATFFSVDTVEILDKYTVRFRLKRPDAPFLVAVSTKNLLIIPKNSRLSPDSFPPGTGPFVFAEWKQGDHVTLERYNDYWQKGIPYLDRVILKPITDENVRLTALRAGDIDIALSAPLHMVDALTKGKFGGDIRVLPPNGFTLTRLRFNVRKPPFDNAKVRQAIAFALNKKELLSGTAWGHGEVTNQKFRKGSFWHLNVPDRAQDLKKAKELLTEAGYPKGFKTSLVMHRDYLAGAVLIQDQLAKIKVMVDIEVVDRSVSRAKLRKRDFTMTVSGASSPVDPNEIYFENFHSKFVTDGGNVCGYVNPALDRLLEEARSIHDPKKRKELYTKFLEIIQREVPEIFLFLDHNYDIARPDVKNYLNNRDDLAHFAGGGFAFVWLDK